MPHPEVKQARQPVDMSPEAIAARIRRVVELNRLCHSLASAGKVLKPPRPEDDEAPAQKPR